MGSKLTVLAAQLIGIAALASNAVAETPVEQFKRGIELYKAGKYAEAASVLQQAYDAQPKPETLFALAQAQRLSGDCDAAVAKYKQLLAETTELATAKAVQINLALCQPNEPEREPAPEPTPTPTPTTQPAPAEPPPPKVIVRDVGSSDRIATGVFAAGVGGVGLGAALLLSSASARDDAASARTLEDHRRIYDRADRDRLIGLVAGSAGAVAIGYAAFRWLRGGEAKTNVAVVPTASGSLMVLSSRW